MVTGIIEVFERSFVGRDIRHTFYYGDISERPTGATITATKEARIAYVDYFGTRSASFFDFADIQPRAFNLTNTKARKFRIITDPAKIQALLTAQTETAEKSLNHKYVFHSDKLGKWLEDLIISYEQHGTADFIKLFLLSRA